MKSLMLAAALAALLAGCAAPSHDGMMRGGMSGMSGMQGMSGMDMEQHMKMMQQMHEKMAAAGTPAERQALMQEHMQQCMSMMQSMPSMQKK